MRATLVGQRFGKQIVLREVGGGKVEVRCDCGTIKTTRKQYLMDGSSRSCGCGRRADRVAPIGVGEVFSDLTVEQKLGTNGRKREVLVRCSCGARKVVAEGDLRSGTVKSCGCFRRRRAALLNGSHGEAGQRRTVLYGAWLAMWERTRRPDRWPTYVGIKVCDEWKSFEAFRDFVNENLGTRPPKHSLDRIENAKGYEPGNIRWADSKQQTRNRKSNIFVEINGIRKCLADWALSSGISQEIINRRLRRGWPADRAVTEPSREYVSRKK